MDKSNLIKLLVVFIAVVFFISLFYQFGLNRNNSATSTTGTSQTEVGTTSTTCNITAFGNEIYVYPWTNQTAAIAEELRTNGEIAYTNVAGNTGILLLPSGSNLSEVRFAFSDLDTQITVESSCNIIGIVNFTLANGTVDPQAPGSVTLNLDPYSQIGDELNLNIVADISNLSIVSMQSTPIPQVNENLENTSIQCGDKYQINGVVLWENRDINTSDIAHELNISSSNISYTKNDAVLFNQQLNNSQIASIKAENLSYIYLIVPRGLEANTTNESLVNSVTNQFGVNNTFEGSPITINVEGELALTNAVNLIGRMGGEVTEERGCTLTLNNTIIVNDKQMLVPTNKRRLNYFINASEVLSNGTMIEILGNASYIGRVITGFNVTSVNN